MIAFLKKIKSLKLSFFFLQVRVVGLAEPGSPTIMHRSMELRALEQQRFRWMLKKLLYLCDHNTVCAQRYGVLWVSWNDKFCYLYRSSRNFNIFPGHYNFFYLGSIHNLPRGWAMMILRGVTLFPYYDLEGGCGKFPTKITSSIEGGATIFFLKKKRKWKFAFGRSATKRLLSLQYQFR